VIVDFNGKTITDNGQLIGLVTGRRGHDGAGQGHP
jgi:hypothetical protein